MDHKLSEIQPVVTENVLIQGNRIAYGLYGVGEPVVLLHATLSSSLIWRNVIPHLTKAGFKVHVFDLLGFGLSERPWDPSVDTSMSDQVRILEGLLDHWGIDSFHLVAHDIGGGIAQHFGVFYPHRLRSLTLVGTVSFDSYPSEGSKEQMKLGLEPLIKATDESHRSQFKGWLLSAVQEKQKFEDTILNTFLDYISGPIGQGSLFQHQIRHYDPKHTMEIAGRLHELGQLPVKLIWGAEDVWQVEDWGHKLNKAIPGSELEVIENCGHFSQEDQPERLSEIVISFLNQHKI